MALALLEQDKAKMTAGESRFIAQYIYESQVPWLTYLNHSRELLDKLLQAYTESQDEANLAVVKSFKDLVETIDLSKDYHDILEELSQEQESLLDELDEVYPVGEEDYTKSFLFLH